ncbi:MAG: DUF4065 domain-containing protein [Alphaproteobacteria bacterium]|nr:DUF4065 domain-containing protein [Alphaproteobacteria bacterium]
MNAHQTFEPDEGINFNFQKFCATIHYVASVAPSETLGRVKLHKILYFADMLNFLRTGSPLTGEDYLKQRFGPTARHLNKALRQLQSDGELQIRTEDFHGLEKYVFEPLRGYSSNELSADETALLDAVIDFVCSRTANEISELSHSDVWQMAQLGERIPYYMAYSLAAGEVTDEDRDWAGEEAIRHGLLS